MQDLIQSIEPIFKDIRVQILLLISFATLHGYAGAWLAVRMLFRPRRSVRLLGIPIFPQGMIPRHRERLAKAIGKAVGDELVSTETVQEQLIGKDFLRNKIQTVVDSYTDELLSYEFPSLIEALPGNIRGPVLETIAGLQQRLAEHINTVLKSEKSLDAIRAFVTRRVDDVLGERVSEVVDDESFDKIIAFLDERLRAAVRSKAFEARIREFISHRVDDLAGAETPIGNMFTDDAVSLLKEKANEQIEPAIHQLTELAAAERTRTQISALIKKEVHEYYENLPFYKKFFVSRDSLLSEVDDLVNDSLPKRIEETLRGESFADEARAFIGASIDNALNRPLPVVIGTIAPDQLTRLKDHITRAVLGLFQGDEMMSAVAGHITDTLNKLRPHSIDSILRVLHPEAEEKLKSTLSRGLLEIIAREESSNIINEILAAQIDRLLGSPIGKLSDHLPEAKLREVSHALTDAIVAATSAKLPEAIAEFDIGGVVREKIRTYPAEKLESLVLSVAKEHLRKIELFGALFGFLIGLAQAVQFYIYAR